MLGDVASHLLDLDAALPRTVRELTLNPGRVARRYIGGERRSYVNPFKYALTLTAVYLIWNALIGYDPMVVMQYEIQSDPGDEPLVAATEQFIARNLNNVFFLALPLFALLLRGLFPRRGFNFAEIYAFVLFTIGHVFLFHLGFAVWGKVQPEIASGVRSLFQSAFYVYGAIVFFGPMRFWGVARVLLSAFLYYVVVFLAAAAIAVPYIAFFADR